MKNLTIEIEEKAKLYDEAIERAKIKRDEYLRLDGPESHVPQDIEFIFPALKESEDENIRKYLMLAMNRLSDENLFFAVISKYKILAWLEKQGEQPNKVSIWKHWKDGIAGNNDSVPTYLIKRGTTYSLSSCLGFECDYIELSELDKLMIEKQGEQKPADTPKFKVGDWVINEHGFVMQIVDVQDRYYVYMYKLEKLSATIEQMEDSCHLWTIQDAKDGDVLTCYSDIKGQPIEQTGIIKQYVGRHGGCSNSFKAHFGVDWDNNVVIEGYMGSSNIHPATKEQCDLLFQKMKEAGYEWDAKDKVLKEIETIDIPFGAKDSELMGAAYYIPEGFHAEIKNNKVIIEKGEQKPDWSEEDEHCIELLLPIIDSSSLIPKNRKRCKEFLESIKERVQPQPTK